MAGENIIAVALRGDAAARAIDFST